MVFDLLLGDSRPVLLLLLLLAQHELDGVSNSDLAGVFGVNLLEEVDGKMVVILRVFAVRINLQAGGRQINLGVDRVWNLNGKEDNVLRLVVSVRSLCPKDCGC